MTSETPATLPAAHPVRAPRPCCGTPMSGPHQQGCYFEPHPDRPVDYNGPAVVVPAATAHADPAPAASTDSTASTDNTPPAEPAVPAWPHETMEWRGDVLKIRVPKRRAVAALQLTLTTSFDQAQQNETISRFLDKHLAPSSLTRVNDRMMDPDDTDYPDDEDYLPLIVAMIERGNKLAKEQVEAEKTAAAP